MREKTVYHYKKLTKIVNNVEFKTFLKNYFNIVDTGKLCEYYCTILLGMKVYHNFIKLGDIVDSNKRIYEVKFRRINILYGKLKNVPAGMPIKHMSKIDSVLYVYLDGKSLLPLKIYRIERKNIKKSRNSRDEFRVTFKYAYNNNKIIQIYPEEKLK